MRFSICIFALFLSVNVWADDLTDAMARMTVSRMKTSYGAAPAYLEPTILGVPVYRASSEFLRQYGSSVGIYFRRAIYLNEGLFLPDSLDTDSPATLAILAHESWHAYYDQLMPQAQRTALERYWASYYGGSRDQAVCFGDEAAGNYIQGITTAYVYTANQYKKKHALSPGVLRIYDSAYQAADLSGYCSGDDTAPRTISDYEKRVALGVSGGAFPPTSTLLVTLQQRLGQ